MSDRSQQPVSGTGMSRRNALRNVAMALTAVGTRALDLPAAEHVHELVRAEQAQSGVYAPKSFNAHEYGTLRRLAELILPADETSGSALDAGAPEFIDLLCSQNEELARIFQSGIAWLDREMKRRHRQAFLDSTEAQQTAMLDQLAAEARAVSTEAPGAFGVEEFPDFKDYGVEPPSQLRPGAQFFRWTRRMTVDAFYTSPIGVRDLGFRGNRFHAEYKVPKESLDYALKRSPFG